MDPFSPLTARRREDRTGCLEQRTRAHFPGAEFVPKALVAYPAPWDRNARGRQPSPAQRYAPERRPISSLGAILEWRADKGAPAVDTFPQVRVALRGPAEFHRTTAEGDRCAVADRIGADVG